MKGIKILFISAIICGLFSAFGVNAEGITASPRSTLDNYLSYNVSVPPYNGAATTAWRTKKESGSYQTIKNIKNTPSYDSLDVHLKYDRTGTTTGTMAGDWEILNNGGTVTFDRDEVAISGYYQLYIDSRVHYTGYTQTSGYWYLG